MDKEVSLEKGIQELKASQLAALEVAFEFGYRCCEKGMNLQRAIEKFYEVMK